MPSFLAQSLDDEAGDDFFDRLGDDGEDAGSSGLANAVAGLVISEERTQTPAAASNGAVQNYHQPPPVATVSYQQPSNSVGSDQSQGYQPSVAAAAGFSKTSHQQAASRSYQQPFDNHDFQTSYQLPVNVSAGRLSQERPVPQYFQPSAAQNRYAMPVGGHQQPANAVAGRVASPQETIRQDQQPVISYQQQSVIYQPSASGQSSYQQLNGASGGYWYQQPATTGNQSGFGTSVHGGTAPVTAQAIPQTSTPGSGWNQQPSRGSTTGFGVANEQYPGWYLDPQTNEYKQYPQEYSGWYLDPYTNEYKQIAEQNQAVYTNEYKQVAENQSAHSDYNQYNQIPQATVQENQIVQVPGASGYNLYKKNPYASEPSKFSGSDPTSHGAFQQSQVQFQPAFHQPPSAQTVSYKELPPRTQQEAMTSTAGRPPHAVVAMGFGGRVVIVKPRDVRQSVEEEGRCQVYQLNQLAGEGTRGFDFGRFSGPLVGNASMKEVLKWIDEKMANVSEEPGCTDATSLGHLWGLLKIACQHYGNLRTTVGKQVEVGPEAALAKLLAPEKDGLWSFQARCLFPTPSEQELQVTAIDVNTFLIAGKTREALQRARQGQLWGPALLLARQLSEKDYSETIADMSRRQFRPGFPLQTLSLLYAGQQQLLCGDNAESPPTESIEGMLEQWQENLAIMAANRTYGDEIVITRLGDWLWKYRSQVASAHMCYLIANVNFEPSRLCLIGADHSSYPRTYALPEAIQRTEVYEYARVSGNSQFILLPFQSYKLIYAYMLAEAGRTSEALRYCQAVTKMLKTAGPGANACKEFAAGLEDRIRLHSQAGSSSIVKRLFGSIGIPKIMGGSRENLTEASNSRPSSASGRSSAAQLSPIDPAGSANTRPNIPVRSISEPDFRPAQKLEKGPSALTSFVHKAIGLLRPATKEAKLGEKNTFHYDHVRGKWVDESAPEEADSEPVLPPPPRVPQFAAPQPAAPIGAPVPAAANFAAMTMVSASNAPVTTPATSAVTNSPVTATSSPITPERPHAAGGGLPLPPMPPGSNQYSARTRTNVRSRYVDTFNKNATPARPTVLPPIRQSHTPAKFFVPAAPDPSIPEAVDERPDSVAAPGAGEPQNDGFKDMQLPNGTSSSASQLQQTGAFYSNHYPASATTAAVPAAALLDVTEPPSHTRASKQEVEKVFTAAAPPPPPPPAAAATASASASLAEEMQEVEL